MPMQNWSSGLTDLNSGAKKQKFCPDAFTFGKALLLPSWLLKRGRRYQNDPVLSDVDGLQVLHHALQVRRVFLQRNVLLRVQICRGCRKCVSDVKLSCLHIYYMTSKAFLYRIKRWALPTFGKQFTCLIREVWWENSAPQHPEQTNQELKHSII